MLINSGLPWSLWGEAVQMFAYIKNCCPHRALGGDVPERVWSDKVLHITHLCIFGCHAYEFIPKDKRTSKLAPRGLL
jgi:hypothetical protein